jgi:hypothetical protein
VRRAVTLIALLVFSADCFGDIKTPLDDRNAAGNATATWFDVGAPVGRMLLIRNGPEQCIVRFTAFHRGHDAKPATAFNSGTESFFAEYDWYHPTAIGSDQSSPRYEIGHRTVALQASAGIGRLAFQPADNEVHCGSFNLVWFYPVRVGFNGRDSVKDIGVELAPTKWTAIEQVNYNDPALRWFAEDEARKPMLIPIDQLP